MSAADIAPAEPAPGEESNAAPAEPKAPPKPRTVDDDLEDIFKKAGGFEYTKGKKVGSVAELKRMMGKVQETDSVATEALKVRQTQQDRDATIEKLAEMPSKERTAALKKLGFSDKAIEALKESVYDDLLGDDAKRQEEAKLSEGERRLRRELEQRDAELAQHRTRAQQEEAQRKEQAFIEENNRLYAEVENAALEGFKLAGLQAGKDSPLLLTILPAIGAELDRAKRLGLELSPADIAESVTRERAKLSDDWNLGRPLEDLSASLGAMEVDDPQRPGQKTTRLKLLLRHEAAKLRASMTPGGQQVVATAPRAPRQEAQSVAEKMAFWRK